MSSDYLSKRKTGASRPSHDDRKGLGYGVLEPTYHLPRSKNVSYPYKDPDQYAETEEQLEPDELDSFVAKTNLGYHITDFMSNKKNDPFYFAAGNSSLGENISANSMVPFPDLYKGRQVALGGTTSGNTHIGSTYPSRGHSEISYGTTHGYSKAPPPSGMRHQDMPAYNLEDILPSDEDIVLDMRMLIDDIHAEQEEGKNES
jgi:hypothetical protein